MFHLLMNGGKKIHGHSYVLDNLGNILKHNNFFVRYKLQCSLTNYRKIIKKIPIQVISLIKEHLKHSIRTPKICDYD